MNYRNLSSKSKNTGLLVCLLIPLLCVFRYYESPVDLLANRFSIFIMIFMVALIPILGRKNSFPTNKSETYHFIAFYLIIVACYGLSIILYDFVWKGAAVTFSKQLYILLTAILCLYCFLGYINHHLLAKIYVNLSVLFAVLGIAQWVIGLVGIGIDMKIPFLEYYNDGEKFTLFSQMNSFTHVPSVFAEASHFAAFLIPAIVFLLAKFDTKYRIIKLALLIGGVFVSTSANGLICLAIVITSFFFFSQKKIGPGRIFIGVVLILLALIALFSGVFSELLEGVFSSATSGETKADYRIYRGLELFKELPIHQKILGIGNANIHVFYSEGLMHSSFDRSWRAIDFLSTLSAIIIYNGLVGLLGFGLFMKSLWTKTSWATKTLILTFVAYSISEDLYFNEFWLLYVALICASRYIFISSSKGDKTKV